ncbi:hypothetical protein HZA44_00055, partial [Candidatus Peregrinibacteria bacterium]|nr:hypothetical protein [Candidatus Peregrinibacteria bacterium]
MKVKSGKVWGGKKADLAASLGIQNLDVEDTPPEVVFSMPKPDISSPLIYTDPTTVAQPSDYAPYYASIALTSNHRPHILSVAPGAQGHSVTVRNVNFFANQINERLNITDPAMMRHVRVTRLAVYDATTIENANPTLITATGDISAQQSGIYTLNISSPLSLALRFELCSNHPLPADACTLVRASSVATLPALTPSTNLTEAQLYPNLSPAAEGLQISAPDTVALATAGSAQNFPVSISGGQNPNLTVDASSSSDCSPANNTLVTFTRAGTCVLTVTATLSNGASATAAKTVTVLPATAVLSLGQPVYSDVGAKRYVTLPWSANNPPLGARFASKLNSSTQQTVPSPMKFEVSPGTQYVAWLIMYRDTSGNGGYNAGVDEELETANVQFTVPSGSTPSADFTISPSVPTPVSGSARTTFVFSAPSVPVAIDTNLYDYVWAGAIPSSQAPENASLELEVLQPGGTATGTVTLTIRDKSTRNVLSTLTKSVSVNRLSEVTQIVYKSSLGNEMASANPETVQKPGTLDINPNYTLHIKALNGVTLASTIPISSPACIYTIDPNITGSSLSVSGHYDTANSTLEGTDILNCRLTQPPAGYALPSASPIASLWVAVTAPAPVQAVAQCGNGIIEGQEACDDGTNNETGCALGCGSVA